MYTCNKVFLHCIFAAFTGLCLCETGMWINYCIFGAAEHASTEGCLLSSVCVFMCVCASMHVCLASADVGVLAVLHRLSERSLASAGWQVDMQCRHDVTLSPPGRNAHPPTMHTHPTSLLVHLDSDQLSVWITCVPDWPPCLRVFKSSSVRTAPWKSHGGHSLCLERLVEKQRQYQIKAVRQKEGGVVFLLSPSLL